mmetsp:Transcript_56075/g.128731  ORF Transcript_56075/g.128731 Transcript_56075/m.128731 type:complete len:1947 (-) Transcript_56075:224-6064(-)
MSDVAADTPAEGEAPADVDPPEADEVDAADADPEAPGDELNDEGGAAGAEDADEADAADETGDVDVGNPPAQGAEGDDAAGENEAADDVEGEGADADHGENGEGALETNDGEQGDAADNGDQDGEDIAGDEADPAEDGDEVGEDDGDMEQAPDGEDGFDGDPEDAEAAPGAAGDEAGGDEAEDGEQSPKAPDKVLLADSFYYEMDAPELQRELPAGQLPEALATQQRFAGFDFRKKYNIQVLDSRRIIYIVGHTVCIYNVETREQRLLHGREDGGVGFVSVDATGTWIAVAEMSTTRMPKVYIYEVATLRLYRMLRQGAQKGYACCEFSPHDEWQIATLGLAPGYLLTIWNWKQEGVLLKCKAFGQDVFRVSWGRYPGFLITTGVSHIRFWKMAKTFTGLKLQGDIGKFGATELSDLTGFVELPQGQIVTGSEYGKLLLWEGVNVKCELMRQGDGVDSREMPHMGAVEGLLVLEEGEKATHVVSGGADGYLRWWKASDIELAEPDYDSGHLEVAIEMTKEVYVAREGGQPAHIMLISRSSDDKSWFLQDGENGCLWKFDPATDECSVIFSAHARAISGILTFPNFPGLAVTSSTDGTLRAHNYTMEREGEMFVTSYPGVDVLCIQVAPPTVDPTGRTIAAGFSDGVVRVFMLFGDCFVLKQAYKPHSAAVKLLEYSPDGLFLVSAAADHTMFFMEMQALSGMARPLGFITLDSGINQIVWNDETERILTCLQNGTMAEFARPVVECIDSSETYEFALDFRAVAPEAPEEEEEEAEAVEDELDDRKDKQDSKDQKKDEEEVEVDLSTSILRAVYLSEDVVLFAATNRFLGKLWEISLRGAVNQSVVDVTFGQHTPTNAMAYARAKIPDVPVTHLSVSLSETFLLIGFADGKTWVLPLANMNYYVEMNCADCNAGVRSLAMTREDNHVLVGGQDGGLYTVGFQGRAGRACVEAIENNTSEELPDFTELVATNSDEFRVVKKDEWDLPVLEKSSNDGTVQESVDIVDPDSYSIQDAKLKIEEENAQAAAERQKRRVRERVRELRKELEEYQKQNEELPSLHRLSGEEMTVDPDYVRFLNKEMEARVQEVKQELAWSVEHAELGVSKLKDRFLNALDFERLEVRAFNIPSRVATFRCQAMSEELQENLAKLHDLICSVEDVSESDSDSDDDMSASGPRQGRTAGSPMNRTSVGIKEQTGAVAHTMQGAGESGQLTSAQQRELRRQLRQERKERMQVLEKDKPSDGHEAQEDVTAIQVAEQTLGDYKLKSSKNYQVPENQRMNAEKKRRQMFLLEESTHAIRTEFNQRVLSLRDFRQQVREEVERDYEILQSIDEQLGTTTPWVRDLVEQKVEQQVEFPEKRFDFTNKDLEALRKRSKKDGGADADAAEGEGSELEAEEGGGSVSHSASKSTTSYGYGRTAVGQRRAEMLKLRNNIAKQEKENAMTKSVRSEATARRWFEKRRLEHHIQQVVGTFDQAVSALEKEKSKLQSDLCNADMKLLVLYEELLMLNELEEKDEMLLRKSNKCRSEKATIMHSIKECQDQLAEKKSEIEHWQQEEATLQSDFTDLVGENSPFLTTLLKIYKRKVKRSKRKKALGDDEDFDEDEESEEESLGSDEESDEDMEDDICPQGCDMSIYESVIELRDKRLDMEDDLQEIQKAVDELKKTHGRLLQEEKKIDKEQKQTDLEIQQFQTEKQRKLNQIKIVFTLKLSQVQCLVGDSEPQLPESLDRQLEQGEDGYVVFTRARLLKLMSRITELHEETKQVRQHYKQLRRDHVNSNKEKKVAEKQIEELNRKFQDIQMLKFGQVVDLDLIERSAPNKFVQELHEKVKDAEVRCRQKLAHWQAKIENARKDLSKITADNTDYMEQIVQMGYSQLQLDQALNARISNVTVNDAEPTVELKEMEKERMKDLLTLQAKEIATLQAEINLFRKKGGHIYTTVTANRLPDRR